MRQNTPHPKELKAKAHKLFAKGSKQSSMEETSEIEKSHLSKEESNVQNTPALLNSVQVSNTTEEEPIEVSISYLIIYNIFHY